MLETVPDCGVSFPEGGVSYMASLNPQFRPDVELPNAVVGFGSLG